MQHLTLQKESKWDQVSQSSQLIAFKVQQGFESRKQCDTFYPDDIFLSKVNRIIRQCN